METVNLVYSIYSMVTTLILVSIAVYSFFQGKSRASKYFSLMMMTIAVYTFFFSLEIFLEGIAAKTTMSKLEYVGFVFIPITFLLFTMEYISMLSSKKKWIFAVLMLPSLFTLIVVFTNQYHSLIWKDLEIIEWMNGQFLLKEYGFAYWMISAYLLTLTGVSTFLLLRFAARQIKIYRLQALLIIIAAIIPWIGTISYLLFLKDYPYIDITATPFLLVGIILFISIFKYRLFNLIPIALDKVFENIRDPIVIVNDAGIIVNMNPPAVKMLNRSLDQCLGLDIRRCMGDHGISLQNILDNEDGRYEITWKIDGGIHHFNILPSRLENKSGIMVGWVLMFRDVTKEIEAQKILAGSKDSLEKLVNVKSTQLESTVSSLRKEIAVREKIEKQVVEEWKRAEFYLDLLNHDMSNINQDMLSRVQIMGLHQAEGAFRSHLNHLELSLKRSIKLVQNVKTLNKLASTPVTHGNKELIGIIQKIMYQLKSDSKLNGVVIDLKNDEMNYFVRGGKFIDEIFRIVIENGVEVQKSGKGKVEIKVFQHPLKKELIRTEISDHGPGIPDHAKEDLLNREKRMGDKMLTGVSLLLARILAERYGGKMKITDRIRGDYRRGASFIIDLKRS